jgi:putative nucleotidyltransferase with HDIG domain
MWWLRIRDLFIREESRTGKPTPKVAAISAAAEPAARQRAWLWPLGVGLVLLVLHLVLFPPVPHLGLDFPKLGEIADRKITAEFPFDAPRLDSEVQMERSRRALVEPPVLSSAPQGAGLSAENRFLQWLETLSTQLADTSSTVQERVSILNLRYPALDREALGWLFASEEPDSLVQRMRRAGRSVLQGGVADMLPTGLYDKVVIKTPQAEYRKPVAEVVPQARLEKKLEGALRQTGMGPASAVRVANVMRNFITPNLVYSAEDTQAKLEMARQSVPSKREFIRGEKIIDQGVRVTEEQAQFLDRLATLIRERGGGDTTGRITRSVVRALLVAMCLGLFAWLGSIHFPGEFLRLRSVLTLGVILAVYLVGASFALSRPNLGPLAVPIVLLSLLTTVLFRDKVGYVATLLAMALLSVLPDIKAVNVFAWFTLGMVTVISVRRIRKRSQFYRTILLLTFLSVVLIFLENVGLGESHGSTYLVGLFAPVLSVAFGLFLLPVVEPMVGVCSDLTLLELSDLNHPLLQRMALEAQGTYHHSQVVGQLAEHAARTIDANSLLTRVGALFHDIGKMQKPEYYVENQSPEANKHDELSPSMSALVIAAHVKEGIELARKWRLPQAVIDFIPEHHGTMVMEYFYHKALNSEESSPVKVDDFRYPGPKPHRRETAILMLADAVEAATRSLAKPTPSRIREITKQIIDKRMLSGELDNSGLTLSDLARIRESFIPLLTGIHHARIVYPGQKDRDPDRVPERRGDRKARS